MLETCAGTLTRHVCAEEIFAQSDTAQIPTPSLPLLPLPNAALPRKEVHHALHSICVPEDEIYPARLLGEGI